MRKKIIGLVLAAITMTSLVGCGNKGSNMSSEGGDIVTIKVLSRYSSDQGPDDIVFNSRIESFMDENPNIKVEHEAIGDEATYNNMFKTSIATGDAPDIFVNYGGTQFQDYVESGLFYDLSKVAAEDKEWADKYIPTMLDAWKYEDIEGFYGVPVACFATGVYYNKDLFAQNGLEVPKTIEEFEKVCDAFMSKGITPFALGDKDNFRGAHLLANLILKRENFDYTKSVIDGETKWNDTAMKEVFEVMSSWQKKGYLGDNITTLDATGEQALFLNGETPMHINGSWFMTQISEAENPERFGFIPFPYFEKYPEYKNNWHSGTSEGISISANNGEERLEASIKLLKYLTDADAYNESQKIAKGGIFPVTTMEEIDDITPIAKEFNEVFVDVQDTKLEPGDYAKNPQLREEIRDAIQGMFAGTSVDDTLARIQKVTDMQ
ncbi:extracellular solute-binding protein [Clostridium sp. NSJ-6]|uniref:Extracellular solute-binding protein n=1 Tax=Clostridium hominis TaxID=2763036 RepID=A0ABR7D8Z3_9CLOT|nr:extracellular solute-binding protein [Clostridium hominis]MBC5627849.1 extracellular solute-binding protein [Clostridium hominis]MDU2672881.1 extracellular solute-binding protein [Clostridium sp.]